MDQTIDIRAVRKDLGLSQTDFASKMGVDQSTVSLWEKRGWPQRSLIREALERRLEQVRAEQAA